MNIVTIILKVWTCKLILTQSLGFVKTVGDNVSFLASYQYTYTCHNSQFQLVLLTSMETTCKQTT